MRNPISKKTRTLWRRRIRDFWQDFSHNRIGLVGLIILFSFIGVAVFSPFIATFPENVVRLESPRQTFQYALPDWFALLIPQFQDLPPQTVYPLVWTIEDDQLPSSLEMEEENSWIILDYNASKTGSAEPVSVTFNASFYYPYSPMKLFDFKFSWAGEPDQVVTVWKEVPWGKYKIGETGSMEYMLQLDIINPDGTLFSVWDQEWDKKKTQNPPPAFWSSNTTSNVAIFSDMGTLAEKLGYGYDEVKTMTSDIFQSKGLYVLRLNATIQPGRLDTGQIVPLKNATGEVSLNSGKLTVWGSRWGLMGSDGYGHDVFSQLIHGCRISILIGVSAALTATVIGLMVGVTAGYLGGSMDEILMRIVDVLLCLPILPMLLVFIALFGYSTWFIVIIIAIFGWQGLSRVIRSQTLSLREATFVESAVASGGTRGYIIRRHIVPNVLPTALTALVLAVPNAIILEAALSFLGLGDPNAPTWGKVLHHAQLTGAFSPKNMAWWDVVPPGLAITLLCLAFVFIGHAIDEVVNPKLRRRR